MKNITRPLFAALLCAVLFSCTKRQNSGLGYMCTLYRSENTGDDYTHVTQRLDQWLQAYGMKSLPSASANGAWTGSHTNDETNRFYSLKIGGGSITLRLSLSPGSRQIDANMDYGGSFTPAELAEVRRASLKLWNDLFQWAVTQPETNDLITHDKDWFANAHKGVVKAYQDP